MRSRPIAVVMGVAVVLPILGPIIFLAMPKRAEPQKTAASQPAAEPHTFAVGGAAAPAAAPAAAGIHIVEASWHGAASAGAPSQAQVFQRGQFTFNRRFFETKFSGFFALIRRESEKNMDVHRENGARQY